MISATEISARQTLDASKLDTMEAIMIRKVFKAMWANALPATRVHAIACAMYDLEPTGVRLADIERGLTRLVQDKTLRSRVVKKTRLYEVNFS